MELPSNFEETDKLAWRIAYLIFVFITNAISKQEHDELDEWVSLSMKNQRLFEELTDPDFIKKYKGYGQIVSVLLNPN